MEVTTEAATKRRKATPTPGIICSCWNCGHEERLPPGADSHHRCSRGARWRHAFAKWLVPEYDYPRYCGTCSHAIMRSEQWGTVCINCSSRALEAKARAR